MDLETGAIVALVRGAEREPTVLVDALTQGLNPELFKRGRPVLEYLMKHQSEHGEVAPEVVVRSRFPDFELPPERPAAMSYYIDELKKRQLHTMIAEAIREAATVLKGKDPNAALALFEKLVVVAQDVSRSSQDVNLALTGDERWERYLSISEKQGIDGMPTGWPRLDAATQGLHRGELITVVARLGTGKTWFLVLLAFACHAAGFVPLVVSREMGVMQIARRVDARRARVPHHELRSGSLDKEDEEAFRLSLKDFAEQADFWVTGDDSALGVAGLEAKLEKLKPDIVFIDGLYLMRDDQGANGWEGLTHLTQDLKRMARRKEIPVVVTTQLNREGRGTGATTANISYSDSIGQDSDVVIGLFQTEDMRLNNELLVKLLKQRDGTSFEMTIRWDLDLMEFEDLSGEVVGMDEGVHAATYEGDSSIPF